MGAQIVSLELSNAVTSQHNTVARQDPIPNFRKVSKLNRVNNHVYLYSATQLTKCYKWKVQVLYNYMCLQLMSTIRKKLRFLSSKIN